MPSNTVDTASHVALPTRTRELLDRHVGVPPRVRRLHSLADRQRRLEPSAAGALPGVVGYSTGAVDGARAGRESPRPDAMIRTQTEIVVVLIYFLYVTVFVCKC